MPEVILIYLFCLSCDFRETGFQSCKFWPLILQPHLPVVDRCSPRSSNSHPTQTRSLLPGPRDQLFASCQQFQILKELPVFVSKKISFLKTKITFCKLDHPQYSICTNQTVTDLLCETMFFLHDCLLSEAHSSSLPVSKSMRRKRRLHSHLQVMEAGRFCNTTYGGITF